MATSFNLAENFQMSIEFSFSCMEIRFTFTKNIIVVPKCTTGHIIVSYTEFFSHSIQIDSRRIQRIIDYNALLKKIVDTKQVPTLKKSLSDLNCENKF